MDTPEPLAEQVEIKVVGKSGQISLGKSYAGKTLRLERRRDRARPPQRADAG